MSSVLPWQPIPVDFRVEIDPRPLSFSPAIEEVVEKIWAAEKQKRGDSLTNGELFSFDRWEKNICYVRPTDYRHFLAQLRKPELHASLKIQTLSVNGLTIYQDSLLMGLRAQHLVQSPGYWELVPSGGLSSAGRKGNELSYQEQLYVELLEETGIGPASVEKILPLGWALDPQTHILEIAAEIQLKNTQKIQAPSGEYESLSEIPLSQVAGFCGTHSLLPFSLELLRFRTLVE